MRPITSDVALRWCLRGRAGQAGAAPPALQRSFAPPPAGGRALRVLRGGSRSRLSRKPPVGPARTGRAPTCPPHCAAGASPLARWGRRPHVQPGHEEHDAQHEHHLSLPFPDGRRVPPPAVPSSYWGSLDEKDNAVRERWRIPVESRGCRSSILRDPLSIPPESFIHSSRLLAGRNSSVSIHESDRSADWSAVLYRARYIPGLIGAECCCQIARSGR